MSLLLDALKKAAEQKAEKSRQEETPAASPSDETQITAADDGALAGQGSGRDLPQSQSDWGDETELDNSELQTRLEKTRVEREDGDDTEIEVAESTQTRAESLSSQMETGEDETIIIADEDISDFLGEPELVSRNQQDETDLSQVAADATDVGRNTGPVDVTSDDDDTDISQPLQPDAPTRPRTQPDTGDDTDFSHLESQPDETSQLGKPDLTDETDLGRASIEDGDAIDDEDMSLLLVDRDDTNLTSRTSSTEPQTTQEITQVLAPDDADVEELALVEKTEFRVPDDVTETLAPTQADSTATTGVSATTQTATGTTTRLDSTSTRTYAPDNYDRTLMRLPSEDASRLFAGMKSDSDVVMTPDYAKKVFRSKSSEQRLQAYKVYILIAVAILLSTAMYGAFEFQDESSAIESNLVPLKRDPMPGIIKPEDASQETSLFADSGVDARTIEIIEGAGNIDEMAPAVEDAVTGEAAVTDATAAVDDVAGGDAVAEVQDSDDDTGAAAVTPMTSDEATQIAAITQTGTVASEVESRSSTLEIVSSRKIEQKDLWLREAYNAYKSGNDSLAMTRYNQVLEVDADNRNALLARAAINVQNNNGNAAIRDYQKLLLQNPKDSLALTSLLAAANYSPLESESQLKLMIRDEPDSPHLNFALANAYGAQNRWQEAQGYYFKALERNPGDPNYAYNLAVSLEHIAQPAAAVAFYQRALDNVDNGPATFNRDLVSQRMEILAKQ